MSRNPPGDAIFCASLISVVFVFWVWSSTRNTVCVNVSILLLCFKHSGAAEVH